MHIHTETHRQTHRHINWDSHIHRHIPFSGFFEFPISIAPGTLPGYLPSIQPESLFWSLSQAPLDLHEEPLPLFFSFSKVYKRSIFQEYNFKNCNAAIFIIKPYEEGGLSCQWPANLGVQTSGGGPTLRGRWARRQGTRKTPPQISF